MQNNHSARSSIVEFSQRDIARMLCTYKWRWILPAVAIAAGAGIYAAQVEKVWEVSQAVMVRNSAAAKDAEPGEFPAADPLRMTGRLSFPGTVQRAVPRRSRRAACAAAALQAERHGCGCPRTRS